MSDKRYSTTRLGFREWMGQVDMAIDRMTGHQGLTSSDIADFEYRDAYDDEATPNETAREALEAEGIEVEDSDDDADNDN